jgi:hypothetical protein
MKQDQVHTVGISEVVVNAARVLRFHGTVHAKKIGTMNSQHLSCEWSKHKRKMFGIVMSFVPPVLRTARG